MQPILQSFFKIWLMSIIIPQNQDLIAAMTFLEGPCCIRPAAYIPKLHTCTDSQIAQMCDNASDEVVNKIKSQVQPHIITEAGAFSLPHR